MNRLLLLSLATLLIFADPASADPISGLLAAGKAFLATKIGAIVAQVALSSGLSLLAQRFRKKPKQPGLQNQFKGRGGSEPGSFVLGRAAVKGHQTYHNSRGDNNKWYHEVIELCDLPGATLERLIIDGEYSEIGDVYLDDNYDSEDPRAQLGNIVVSKNKDSDSHRAFIKYYDGTHTTADAMLVSFFASDDRRWTTDHKLLGICHTVESYYFDRKRFPRGLPEKSYELLGPPCYDPRKDTSVGGSGAHRYDDPDTWEQSENLIVLVYTILRGIAAPGGGTWGGDCEHEDLPMANWVAAMNACDIDVDGRAKYTGGIEARWTDEPRDIIDQLLAGCNGQITELGGVYRVQVDAPETAVVSLTDDDFSVSDPSELDPFPGLDGTFNGGSVTHPDPAQLWNASAAHTITNPTWETQDGTRRLFDLQMPVVHNSAQAKQVLNAAINDGRRFRRHKGTLPPDLFFMDTLNTFAWTSEAEGYSNKLFEISETAYDLLTFNTVRSIRERDPSDFPIVPGLELPGLPTATGAIARPDAGVPGFDIVPVTVDDGNGNRRITFKLIWDAADIEETVAGISYEMRLTSTEELVLTGDISDVAAGQVFLPGDYVPGASYGARGRALSRVRDTDWTDWVTDNAPAVSDNVRIVQLTTGNQVFTYNGAGASPAPTSTDFTATARGLVGTGYFEFFVDDVSQGAPSTTATFNYTPKASADDMPDVVRVELRDGGATEDVVGSDRITVIGLVPGEAGVAMILTNEAHTVPSAPDGSGEDLSGAFTDVAVYVGAQLDTANWTITRVDSADVNSSISGVRVTVTDLDADSGWVDITASRSGFSSIVKRFSLSKARAGVAGNPGKSTYQAVVFRRAASAPSTPSGGSFNFATEVLTPPSGWSVTPPVGSDPLYAVRYLFSITGDTGTDTAGSWSTPAIFVRDGADGVSTYLASIFRRAASTPATPSGGSYNFDTQVLTPPSGWGVGVPSGSDPLYVSTTLASVQGTTATDSSLTWTNPQIMAKDGEDGSPGTPGTPGARGPGRWNIARSPLPTTSSSANSGWRFGSGPQPSTPVIGDQAWFYTGTEANPTGQSVWICTSVSSSTVHSWAEQNEVVDGNLLVTDTVSASAIRIDDITIDSDGAGNLIVKNGAVSKPIRSYGSLLNGNGFWRQAASITIGLRSGAQCYIILKWAFEQGYSGSAEWGFGLKENGTVIRSREGMEAMNDYPSSQLQTNLFTVIPTAGGVDRNFTYILDWKGSSSNITAIPYFEVQAIYK